MLVTLFLDHSSGRAGLVLRGTYASRLGPGQWVRDKDQDSSDYHVSVEAELWNKGFYVFPEYCALNN